MKYVYAFSEGNKDMRNTLGGKGANLAEMTSLGLPVPQGFTVSTDACIKYYEENETINKEIEEEILSGARVSMPGMMDTVLNLGMTDSVALGFSEITNNKRFVYDSYRRFIQMFADVVMNFPKSSFEKLFDKIKEEKNVINDTDLTADDLLEVINRYKIEYRKYAGCDFPQDAKVQLLEAIKAVFRSWNTDRAKTYRRLNNIPSNWGTAVKFYLVNI